ncbi:MAG: hypothetical protein IAF94_14155 [Pirellulaceae bacterium]|nr:hypothetical protein [Pirellulaceae bacterium]
MRLSLRLASGLLTSAAMLFSSPAFAQEGAEPAAAEIGSYYAEGAIGTGALAAEQQAVQAPAAEYGSVQAPYSSCEEALCDDGCHRPWRFNFSQTAGYGTNLALPITLTPANTLITSPAIPGGPTLLDLPAATSLGLLDDLGLIPGPVANQPTTPFFKDDFRFQTDMGLQNTQQLANGAEWTNGYAFYQTLHPSVEQLNLQSHTFGTAYSQQVSDRVVATADYAYAYYYLDGDSFISQNQLGGALLFRANDQWDYQVRAQYLDAHFFTSPFLSSDTYLAKLEALRYLGDCRTNYLTGGYTYAFSDAVARAFTYQVNGVFIGGRWLYGCEQCNELKVTFTYGSYDFYGDDIIDLVPRQDNIYVLQTYLGRQLNDNWTLFGNYTYYNSVSNVLRQDYDSSLISIGLAYIR